MYICVKRERERERERSEIQRGRESERDREMLTILSSSWSSLRTPESFNGGSTILPDA